MLCGIVHICEEAKLHMIVARQTCMHALDEVCRPTGRYSSPRLSMSGSTALQLPAAQPLPPKDEPNTGFIKEEPAPDLDTELPRAAANGPEEVRPERRGDVHAIRDHLVGIVGAAMYCTLQQGARALADVVAVTYIGLCVSPNMCMTSM